jgi:antitoxin component YwqK of YwqJK toxin-antitoxin module
VTADRLASNPEPIVDSASYPKGGVKYTGFRLAGEPHGAWHWYRLDGSLMRTGSFDRGTQVGTWQTFDRAGRLVKETKFT